jgi:hypothetical protein
MNFYYFDYAAATPLDERVLSAMTPYFTDKFYNPSSPYLPAVGVRHDYEQAKKVIAQIIGATGDEIIMTAGATESINIAINSINGHKICSAIEHDSVINTVKSGDHTIIPVLQDGRIDIKALKSSIRDDTKLISVALANHEIGTIQPIKEIAQIIKDILKSRIESGNKTDLLLHCDASQGCGMLDINVGRLSVDMLTLNAAKIYGPKQVGLLWVRPGVSLKTHVHGGGQELGIRSGTENVAGVIGFAEAIRLADKRRKGESKRLSQLRDYMEERLMQEFPSAIFSGNKKHKLPNFLHVSFPNIDAERLIFILENKNILVATGSACAAKKGLVSHVLTAIGMDESLANGSLRITLGRDSDRAKCDFAISEIVKAVKLELTRTGNEIHD